MEFYHIIIESIVRDIPCLALLIRTWLASLERLHGIFRFALPVLDYFGDWAVTVGAAVQRSMNDGT